jgi:hypothetical protein
MFLAGPASVVLTRMSVGIIIDAKFIQQKYEI